MTPVLSLINVLRDVFPGEEFGIPLDEAYQRILAAREVLYPRHIEFCDYFPPRE
ncbi:MAG: hypothetical protein PHS44_06395 [Candidatus Dojkabacteria bacterium]|nr:hypothetical protein [Candidatus Dojkabacteria bacterium]